MGKFRIEIDAVGNHGANREIKDGEALDFEELPETHVDRVVYEAVEALKSRGATINSAKLIHWPKYALVYGPEKRSGEGEIVDDVLESVRRGSF